MLLGDTYGHKKNFFKGGVEKVYIAGGSQRDFFRGAEDGEISLFPLAAKKTTFLLKCNKKNSNFKILGPRHSLPPFQRA